MRRHLFGLQRMPVGVPFLALPSVPIICSVERTLVDVQNAATDGLRFAVAQSTEGLELKSHWQAACSD